MATARHTLVVALSFLLLALLLLLGVGCQSQPVSALPPPSFNGPVVVAPPQRPMPPPVHPIAPRPPTIQPQTNVPKDWIPYAAARPWKWIVIHHSATPTGSAAVFDKMHRDKGWDELGYDFVIGNGTDSGNGQIEVGPRWGKQKWGAHAKTPDNRFNDFGIGICLVGNFDNTRPTAAQIQSLARLTAYLMKTYHIPAQNIIGHSDTKATDCPGRYMNVAAFRQQVSRMLADAKGDGAIDVDAILGTAPAEPQTAADVTPAQKSN